MKLKINKTCDLSSISVFPPYARRSSTSASGLQTSQFRTQSSQQSFSQGLSPQHGVFSQLSQSSLDEVVTNDQIVCSQEREYSAKKFSSLPLFSYTRDESQMPMSRSSSNLAHKWNPVSTSDQRCQISEELERRIGMMETALNRLRMILDSVQSDTMKANRGSKEVLLEVQGICRKLVVQDTSLQLMNKGHEDVKACLDGCLKSLSDQWEKNLCQDKYKDICVELSSSPGKIEASLLKLRMELCNFLTKEMKAMASNLKSPNHMVELITILAQKAISCGMKTTDQDGQVATVPLIKLTGHRVTSPGKPKPLNNPPAPPDANVLGIQDAKIEMGAWKSVKKEQSSIKQRVALKELKRKGVSSVRQAKECRIIIDSDGEIEGGFSWLISKKEIVTGNNENKMMEDAKIETERILRKARRQKRKYDNRIIIN